MLLLDLLLYMYTKKYTWKYTSWANILTKFNILITEYLELIDFAVTNSDIFYLQLFTHMLEVYSSW